ncbi:expressed unknown protein [Ectocarpus siliculosus]|uniref:Uncharacterized protein n=1 Tax=Ectocarpus siliculosus TaxID=2880 RepID=D7G338_ECTSI|nr:expressed unknown protein [Ectocarpus siliculosus]|eukprot:CBJ33481.1 expressed unknown protein [Ectocarpus siliculosus]
MGQSQPPASRWGRYGVPFQTNWHTAVDCLVIISGIYSSIVFSHHQRTHMSKSLTRTT